MTYNEMKERAKELGIDFTGQPSKDDLEKWITEAEAKLGGIDPVAAEEAEAKAKLAAEEAAMAAKEAKFEKPEKPVVAQVSANKANPLRNAMKMVKVKITPLDERMRGIPSEVFSVGNKHTGFIKKVVRFNQPTWEPEATLQMLREKTRIIQETEVVNGKEIVRKKQAEAYSITVLPLTADDKAALAKSK